MADITYSLSMRLDKDNLSHSITVNNVTATMGTAGFKSITRTVNTASAALIDTSGLASPGICFLRNLNTSTLSTAQVGVLDSSNQYQPVLGLRAGEQAVLRLVPSVQYYIIGTSGTTVRYDVTEA